MSPGHLTRYDMGALEAPGGLWRLGMVGDGATPGSRHSGGPPGDLAHAGGPRRLGVCLGPSADSGAPLADWVPQPTG